MKIIIIGAVAAGTSAAAKARRNNEDAEIVVYEKDAYISYSGCGMPYYLGGKIASVEELIPRNPSFFKNKYNVDILTGHEVLSINPDTKTVMVKVGMSGEVFVDHYDKLIIATGAEAIYPKIAGIENPHVFTLRNIVDVKNIATFIELRKPKHAVIIGTGFIGLEVCENLVKQGIFVTLVEQLPQVTPGLDADMAQYVQTHILRQAVDVITGNGISEIYSDHVTLTSGEDVAADLVIIATGVRPQVKLAEKAGVLLGKTGAIQVNQQMQTNIPGIYACGDCIEHYHLITGKSIYRPLGSTANKTGRIAGDCATGGDLEFRGILGTGIFKIFDLVVAQTGFTEREAKAQGYEVRVCHNIKPDKPEYMGGKEMIIKAVADKMTGRLLGVQIIGEEGVDKRIDVFVTAVTFKAKVEDLFHLDLAYAPPFSTTKDPVMYTGMILDNAIQKKSPLITANDLNMLMKSEEKYTLIDVRIPKQYEKGHIPNAVNMPLEQLRHMSDSLDKETLTITYCNKGVSGNAAQNILLNKGFEKVYNISGGYKHYSKIIKC